MTRLPDRFIEDRAVRDAARSVLAEDIDLLRASLAEQGIASRVSSGVTSTISDRLRAGAHDVFSEVKAQAGERKGLLALLVAAVILWFSRSALFDAIEELLESDYPDDETIPDEPVPPEAAPEGDPA
ncbi:MAG: hypothetical protein K2Q29_13360 [Sphingomonadales bacterium]|nr:hypothetical protein [Sphingomonadales bacterium]